jgi:hypothetical protein
MLGPSLRVSLSSRLEIVRVGNIYVFFFFLISGTSQEDAEKQYIALVESLKAEQ